MIFEACIYGGLKGGGGEREIRTPEGLITLDGFQDRCIQPLCHLSVTKEKNMEATPGFEPGMGALQAPALPLGYIADNKKYLMNLISHGWCEWPESNRHGRKSPRDFKSLVSTYSTTLALLHLKTSGAGDGDRTRGPNLGKVVLYH